MWGESKTFNIFADIVVIAAMCALLVADIKAAYYPDVIESEASDVQVESVDELMELGEDDE